MNYCKENLVKRLDSLHQELICDDADKSIVGLILEAKEYIADTPATYDKATVVQALACYGCRKCSEDFDAKRKRCADRYIDAELFYEHQVLDEHDEDVMPREDDEDAES